MLQANTFKTETSAITIAATSADASATVVYTCPPNYDAYVDLLHVANNNNATKKVYVQLYHADTTTYHHILKNFSIAGNSAHTVLDSSTLYLHSGDKILMYGETTNTMEGLLSAREFFNPNRT